MGVPRGAHSVPQAIFCRAIRSQSLFYSLGCVFECAGCGATSVRDRRCTTLRWCYDVEEVANTTQRLRLGPFNKPTQGKLPLSALLFCSGWLISARQPRVAFVLWRKGVVAGRGNSRVQWLCAKTWISASTNHATIILRVGWIGSGFDGRFFPLQGVAAPEVQSQSCLRGRSRYCEGKGVLNAAWSLSSLSRWQRFDPTQVDAEVSLLVLRRMWNAESPQAAAMQALGKIAKLWAH